MRVIDIQNEKVFRVRFEDPAELRALRVRLGFATFFPYLQPENSYFELDFGIHDQRIACFVLFTLMQKERMDNVAEFSYTHADGVVDNLTTGIPRFWWTLKGIPHSGVFRCSYYCSPEDRNIAARKQLLKDFGYWEIPNVQSEDVIWRMGLKEAPEDVMEFVEFLVGLSRPFFKIFRDIDGPGGNGSISLREFEDGYKVMVKRKELKPSQKRIVTAVFRFLDRTGEGSISIEEWGVLNCLYDEIRHCLEEFVQFCESMFGPNLADTWNFLDDDGSGEISLEEWEQAVFGIGYFGPARPIFGFLDKDNEGNLSLDEFEALNEFATEPDPVILQRRNALLSSENPLGWQGDSAPSSPTHG